MNPLLDASNDRIRELTRDLAAAKRALRRRESRADAWRLKEAGILSSERGHFTDALRDTWVLLKTLIRSSPLAIMACDNAGRVTVWNLAAQRLFGWSEERVLGMYPPALSRTERKNAAALLEEVLGAGSLGEREIRCRREDGRFVDVGLFASRLEDETGGRLGLLGMFLDITERKRLEREVAEISENERRRIGRDLHDGLGQMLSGIGLSSKALEKKLAPREPALSLEARNVSQAASLAVARIRNLSHLLFPEELERGGLRPALRNLADNAAGGAEIACSFQEGGLPQEPDKETALQLFRIAQEAVQNALKHGRPRNVRLSLNVSRGRAALTVADDGVGIRRRGGPKRGIGLRLMKHRAALIGASLSLDSGRGKGTTIRCVAPLRAPPRRSR